MTAFQATFSDFRVIKGRKVCQFVFETPIEAADAALQTLGGVPRPDQEAWVGIARIDPKNATSEAPKLVDAPILKGRRRFNTLPLSQQAAMRCNEPAFWRFLIEQHAAPQENVHIENAEEAAAAVRLICEVGSRSELNIMHPSGDRWMTLEADYELWMHPV